MDPRRSQGRNERRGQGTNRTYRSARARRQPGALSGAAWSTAREDRIISRARAPATRSWGRCVGAACSLAPGLLRLGLRRLDRRHLEGERLLQLARRLVRLRGRRLRPRLEVLLVAVRQPAARELRSRRPRPPPNLGHREALRLARDDLRDAALAAVVPRLALAAAHARARPLADRLRRVDRERAAASVHHLRLGHLLALAHDVLGGRDAERVDALLVVGRVDEALVPALGHDHRRPVGVEGWVGGRVEPGLAEQPDDLERDRGRAGYAGRVDAGRVDQVGLGGAPLDDPVAAARLRTRAREGVEGVVRLKVGHEAAAGGEDGGEDLLL
mmetsp:Transcript_3152/g.9831  ORF Transcript_3152/g.9831 Transcript_3152/m.9831 type:complete len:329 (-) Transcript_3152:1409-2395(-)